MSCPVQELHLEAKAADPTVIPPLAKLHLDGRLCGGLGDLYYVTAVSIKRLVDTRNDTKEFFAHKVAAHTTLLTLLYDSGLHAMAESQLQAALEMSASSSSNGPGDGNVNALKMRSTLMTPALFDSLEDVASSRSLLVG